MKISTKLRSLLLVGGIACSSTSFAQDEIGDLIKSSREDATALTRAYLTPFFKGTGLGLSSGWSHTGTTKKLLRFDIKVGGTLALPPASDKSFDVTKLGLSSNIRPMDANNVISPTIAGKEVDGVRMGIYRNVDGLPGDEKITEFNLPQGLNVPMPALQLQANIGLVKGIEAMIRYSPDTKIGSDFGTFGMKGGGIKFQPFKLIPGGKKLSKLVPVDIAIALGYNSINYTYDDIQVKPESGAQPKAGTAPISSAQIEDQKFEVKFSGISAEVIASKKLLFLTPFVSVGYITTSTKAGLYGSYPITTGGVVVNNSSIQKTYEIITDPVDIDEKFASGLRAGAGLGINLFIFHIYGSYNLAPYKYLNAGVAIGFGK